MYAHSPVFQPCWQAVCPPFVAGWGASQDRCCPGCGGPQGGVFMAPPGSALAPPLCLSPPPGTQVPLSCGERAARLSAGPAGPCPLSCGRRLQRAGQFWLCPGGRWPAEAPWLRPRPCGGASGWELGGGAHGALFSRASAFPEPCPWEPTLAKEEGLSCLKGVLTLGLAPSSPATAQPGAVSRDVTAGDWPL